MKSCLSITSNMKNTKHTKTKLKLSTIRDSHKERLKNKRIGAYHRWKTDESPLKNFYRKLGFTRERFVRERNLSTGYIMRLIYTILASWFTICNHDLLKFIQSKFKTCLYIQNSNHYVNSLELAIITLVNILSIIQIKI